MKLVVLTPASRPENWDRLRDNLECAEVTWVPIASVESLIGPFQDSPEWIQPFCATPQWGDACYQKLNTYFREADIDPDTLYLTLCDDSLYEPGFFSRLRAALEGVMASDALPPAVAVCSALRGHNPIEGGHGISTLHAAPDQMRFGSVTLEQLMLRGSTVLELMDASGIARAVYRDNSCADGILAEELQRQYGPSGRILFVPQACVLFNALQPGRWSHLPDGCAA